MHLGVWPKGHKIMREWRQHMDAPATEEDAKARDASFAQRLSTMSPVILEVTEDLILDIDQNLPHFGTTGLPGHKSARLFQAFSSSTRSEHVGLERDADHQVLTWPIHSALHREVPSTMFASKWIDYGEMMAAKQPDASPALKLLYSNVPIVSSS